jgi:hypothetical protein
MHMMNIKSSILINTCLLLNKMSAIQFC